MSNPVTNSYTKHPMQELFNNTMYTGCDPNTGENCACTDPSYGYSNPCTLNSPSNGSTGRTKCYYTSPSVSGLTTGSPGPSLSGSSTNRRFSAKPGTGARQYFTSANSPNTITSGNGAASTYPTSLLFCANPEESATSAKPTNPTPSLSYNTSTNQFGNWTATQTGNTTSTNLGFD